MLSLKNISLLIGALLFQTQSYAQEKSSLLWEVRSPEGKVSHLFGTYHLMSLGYLKGQEKVNKAYDSSSTIVVEMVVDSSRLREFAMQGLMADHKLPDLLDSADYHMAATEFERVTGVTLSTFDNIKPIQPAALYTQVLAMRKLAGKYRTSRTSMDLFFGAVGQKMGKEVIPLETMMEQSKLLFEGFSLEDQAEFLVDMMRDSIKTREVTYKLINAYLEEDLDLIWELGSEDQGQFLNMEALLDDRNLKWVDTLMPILDKGDAFIAVGALHLPGKLGLIELLRKEGYTLSPVF